MDIAFMLQPPRRARPYPNRLAPQGRRRLARPASIAYKARRFNGPQEEPGMSASWAARSGDPESRYGPGVGLVVVDVQNDFADPHGSLYVKGGSEIVPVVNAEIQRASKVGAAVVYTRDWHPLHTPHFAGDGGIWPVHCVAETWGAEPYAGLDIRGPVVLKGTHGEDGYSGFSMRNPIGGLPMPTELDSILARGGVKRLVVCGLATDYCVKATALDGVRLGYEVVVLLDAVRAVNLAPGDGLRSLDEMAAAGVGLIGDRTRAR
jgi:nicotinamidase/pyrazinamidase